MIWVTRLIFKNFARWEKTTQIAFVLALILLVLAIGLFLLSPPDYRVPIVIGIGLLIIVMQGIVLWGNRTMVTPYTQAQRMYLAGDLEGAQTVLEAARAGGSADVWALTLLGSTYRQMGRLSESEGVLYEALDKAPAHHFPLYNNARTWLSMGRYDDALTGFQRALEAGAPKIVRFDVAETLMLLGRTDEAGTLLTELRPTLMEPYRVLMAAWWLSQLGLGEKPPRELIAAGLPYWEAAAERFGHSSYGQATAASVAALRGLMGDEESYHV